MLTIKADVDEELFLAMKTKALTEDTKEILNEAITLYGWALEQIYGGFEICAVDASKNSFKMLNMKRFEKIKEALLSE